jgi:hypothetical protein
MQMIQRQKQKLKHKKTFRITSWHEQEFLVTEQYFIITEQQF